MLKDASGKSKKCAYIKLADESVVESIMATDDHFIAPGSALKQTTYLSIYLSLSLSIYIYISHHHSRPAPYLSFSHGVTVAVWACWPQSLTSHAGSTPSLYYGKWAWRGGWERIPSVSSKTTEGPSSSHPQGRC